MDALMPETDVFDNGRSTITEKSVETLRPAEAAGLYIPIPNCIVRSPGKDLKMIAALRRMIFQYWAIVRLLVIGGFGLMVLG